MTQCDGTLTSQIKDSDAEDVSSGNQVNCYKVKREKEDCGDNRTGFQPPHLRTVPRGTIQGSVPNAPPGS